MPPKTRGGLRILKATKENIGVNSKCKVKPTNKTKEPRKALADKTNSASDDNSSHVRSEPAKKIETEVDNLLIKRRTRRERRLPNRYAENILLQNLSNSKNEEHCNSTPNKNTPVVFQSPLLPTLDSSLVANRPKRICRLPSKFDEHSLSLSKFVPVQPVHASTPKVQNKPPKSKAKKVTAKVGPKKTSAAAEATEINKKQSVNKKTNNTSSKNNSADTNNNAKEDQLPHIKTKNTKESSNIKSTGTKNQVVKNISLRILDDKKKSLKRDSSNIDVYEFTYDPNEEPPPQKKKKRKPAKKREPKPKTVTFKSNYDKNLAKALMALKSTVSSKSKNLKVTSDDISKPQSQVSTQVTTLAVINSKLDVPTPVDTDPAPIPCNSVSTQVTTLAVNNSKLDVPTPVHIDPAPIPCNSVSTQVTTLAVNNSKLDVPTPVHIDPAPIPCNSDLSLASAGKYNSVCVEDIALDFETDCGEHINYSPVNSPIHSTTPTPQNMDIQESVRPAANDDPLNLRDDLSFFDDQPVASSSMNVSSRHPAASPWRVEFNNLPIKWQVNTYVKANMTPAFESSFINFNESKKHVYTNMGLETNSTNDLPQIYDDNASKLKQTSIITFIKEVVEKNAKKKKDKMTPVKANSLFEDFDNSVYKEPVTPKKHVTPKKNPQSKVPNNVTPNQDESCNMSEEKEKSGNSSKETDKENSKDSTKSSSKKKKDKNMTYFGFDDENQDQENVSPVKRIDKRKLRALKPRSRAVLQEINSQKGPFRAELPVAMKSKPDHIDHGSDNANKLFDQMKSATEPPDILDKEPIQSTEVTNMTAAQNNEDSNEDDQSVHLFEDIEVVHHMKAHRKSYGKAKKAVTFRQNSISDSDVSPTDAAEQSDSSDVDDLHDLTFKMPAVQPKKATRKKKAKPKLSKKEEQEVEAWAAGFNSMCEDIEEFDLVLE